MRFILLALSVIAAAGAAALPPKFLDERPRLVLVVVIDQFRADYLARYRARFLPPGTSSKPGGFRYLMEKGAYFPNGQYEILQNMTGPGHATILTGSYPYLSGIPINKWYETATGASRYCVAESDGTVSPRALLVSTVGDELKGISPNSRVVALALKDRAAVLLGGHRADLALWFDVKNSGWSSSSFYLDKKPLPDWVATLNRGLRPRLAQAESTSVSDAHTVATSDEWLATPRGLEVTEEAAERALVELSLGKNKTPDILAVSFSSHDYAGHKYGPDAPELAEMTVAEDKLLAKLLAAAGKQVPGGLGRVLVVLTADHGIVSDPVQLKAARLDAGRLDTKALVETLEQKLQARFGKSDEKWIAHHEDLNFYLNPKAIADRDVEQEVVEEEVKKALRQSPSIQDAFSASDYRAHRLPPGQFTRQIEKTYFPGRSGDVIGILKPFHIPADDTVTHMTGYSYDRTVPILFAGPHVKAAVHPNEIAVVDIAPTLAFFLGTIPPSGSEGKVVKELFPSP